ncbi:hypothetical protein Pelo_18103 [Pelomyxa schiedti]|nr:hypothetical protein Pelo_18103 [Pelomyxa schiedti]
MCKQEGQCGVAEILGAQSNAIPHSRTTQGLPCLLSFWQQHISGRLAREYISRYDGSTSEGKPRSADQRSAFKCLFTQVWGWHWEDVVNEGVTYFLEQGYIRSAMLLLNTFDGLPVKELVSRGKFSVDQIAETVSARLDVRSGKVVKWLIQEFNLNREQVNIDNLVEDLINGNKSNCLEWLIRRFHLTLNEIARICSIDKIGRTNTSIGTWKMLLRVFPEMTAAFAMEHLRDFVTATPLHLEAAKKSLGITKAQATAAVDKRVLWSKLLWLGVG